MKSLQIKSWKHLLRFITNSVDFTNFLKEIFSSSLRFFREISDFTQSILIQIFRILRALFWLLFYHENPSTFLMQKVTRVFTTKVKNIFRNK